MIIVIFSNIKIEQHFGGVLFFSSLHMFMLCIIILFKIVTFNEIDVSSSLIYSIVELVFSISLLVYDSFVLTSFDAIFNYF